MALDKKVVPMEDTNDQGILQDMEHETNKKKVGLAQQKKKAASAVGDRLSNAKYVFDPNSTIIMCWDLIVCVALVFTTFVTPFEIAILSTQLDALFVLNRLFDLIFLWDIYVNMRVAYFDQDNGIWIVDPWKCARRYLASWFLIDAISLVPWDVLSMAMNGSEDSTDCSKQDEGGMGQMKVLRLLKILKIFKLIRVVKGVKAFDQLATQLMLRSTSKLLMKYLVMMTVATHWLATAWCLWKYSQ